MKEESIKIADAILAKGHRVLMIPVKDGERIFEIDQKEVKAAKLNKEPPSKR